MNNYRRILFIIPTLAGGGAERVLALILRYLDKSVFEPVVVLFGTEEIYEVRNIDNLRIIQLRKRTKADNLRLIFALAKVIRKERPDAILTFMHYANILTSAAMILSSKPNNLIHSDHNNLTELIAQSNNKSIRKIITKMFYKTARRRVCVSKGVKADLCNNWNEDQEKCEVIYNPIDYDEIQMLSEQPVNHPWFKESTPIIIACGRLHPQKNYPLLIDAFSEVVKYRNARLVILGKGELENEIKKRIKEKNLEDRIALLGFAANPFKYIAKSRLFVLTSDSEGFGNVIVESMACGTSVVSTACPSGPDEIITHQLNGWLVPVGDKDKLTTAINNLLENDELNNKLAAEGRIRAQDFDIKKIIKRYEKLFL